MLITISGTPGAGKGTVAKLLGQRLHLPVFSTGDIRRSMAKSQGMTLEEFNRYGETHPSTDIETDRRQQQKAQKLGKGIFEGRTMFYFIPGSIKIFLSCSISEGARRICQDHRRKRQNEADISTLRKSEESIRRRIASDRRRYSKFYRINVLDRRNYDFILSTTRLTPQESMQKILKYIKKTKHGL